MRERLRLAHVVWAVSILFVLASTAAPFHFDTSPESVSAHLSRIPLNPLISPDTGRRISIPDFVQNVLLFVPFGAAAVSVFGGRSPRRDIRSAVLLGCALSVGAEAVQLLTTDRISSLADVLANSAGTLIGATIVATSRRREWAGRLGIFMPDAAARPTAGAVLASALLVCVAMWEPFDVTLDVGVIAGHLQALHTGFWQASFSTDHVVVFVLFLLFGFMLTQWIHELPVRFPVVVGMVTAIAAGIALEAGQILIESRLPTAAEAAASATGAFVGGVVSSLHADVRSKLRVLTLGCVLAAAIAIAQWVDDREAGWSALRNIGLCLVGAYVGIWGAAPRFPPRAD